MKQGLEYPYTVRGFAPSNAGGYLLLETRHRTITSRDTEIAAWQTRRRRGDVGVIEVIDHEQGRTEQR